MHAKWHKINFRVKMSAQNIKCNSYDTPWKNLKQGIWKHIFFPFFFFLGHNSQFSEDNIIGDGMHLLKGKKIEETTCQVKNYSSDSKISFKHQAYFFLPFSMNLPTIHFMVNIPVYFKSQAQKTNDYLSNASFSLWWIYGFYYSENFSFSWTNTFLLNWCARIVKSKTCTKYLYQSFWYMYSNAFWIYINIYHVSSS